MNKTVPATGITVRKEGCSTLSLIKTMLAVIKSKPIKGKYPINFPTFPLQVENILSRLTRTSIPPNNNSHALVGNK